MLFVEEDAPLIKAWIVRRLENNSDADADVLADYVLALLRHDGSVETIRKLFEEEIPDFLREDATAFTHDVLQAVKYRSYLPGAPPPPRSVRQPPFPSATAPSQTRTAPRPDTIPSPTSLYDPSVPYSAPPPPVSSTKGGSRKRAHSDHDDGDVDIILTSQPPQGRPHKQPRRGGGFGQPGGRYEEPYGARGHRGPPAFPSAPGLVPYGAALSFPPPIIDPATILENIQILQSLLPSGIDLPQPVYSGTAFSQSRRKNKRCRDYDTKGFCSRGNDCKFEHGIQTSYILPPIPPGAVDEYDPNNAVLSLPPFGAQQPSPAQLSGQSGPQLAPNTNRRDPKKSRRGKGRVPFTSNGPNIDRSKKTIVIQNIPSENFTEEQVRGYFSQFGSITKVTMENQNRLAIIEFDKWDAANAAWSSPKVIFDNRFVKVFWYKDEGGDEAVPGKKLTSNAANGHTDGNKLSASAEPELDMTEFHRKQLEAQKVYEEKTRKRQEVEQEREKLEERQKELRERQAEAKRQLQAKLKPYSTEDDPSSPAATSGETGNKKTSIETESLRAQLAALEKEANQLGIDPDDYQGDVSSWPPWGRGRGRGYRGRGTYVPRAARGSYGYQGRGGIIEARHAAYAVYSLDNRPKAVVLSGVDFTMPEHDEALRQYLFSIGEFKEVHAMPAATHVIFKDRKTAEKFMFGVSASNSIHGIDAKIEPAWANTIPESAKMADGNSSATNIIEEEQATKGKMDTGTEDSHSDFEEGEINDTPHHDQGDMDYEAGEW